MTTGNYRLDLRAEQLSLDLRGHYGMGLREPVKVIDNGDYSYSGKLWQDNFPYRFVENFVPLLALGIEVHERCSICNESVAYVLDGDVLTAQSECPYPNGYPAFTVSLEVPSGKIIIDNDLRSLTALDYRNYDVNAMSEKSRLTKNYAVQEAMVHIFVGNSCPSIYRKPDGSLTIENPPVDDDCEWLEVDGEKLGQVITDLWWFSAMDFDDFKQRCASRHIDPNEFLLSRCNYHRRAAGYMELDC